MSKTKKSLGLCDRRGCHDKRADGSMFCESHREIFSYLDMADSVNIPIQGVSKNEIFSNIRKQKRRIIDAYFRGLVDRQMSARSEPSDERKIKCACGQYITHIDSRYCKKHLRLDLMKNLRLLYKERQLKLPKEIKEKLRSTASQITPELLESVTCRMSGCGNIVDKWPHIGFCSLHIHTPESIETIKCRYAILQSSVAIPDLRRMIVGYI
jgi:hypothetical protein